MWSDSDNYGGDFVSTRADGSYVINNQVPPGTYYLAFLGGCGNSGSYGQVAYNSPSPYSPAPVTVTSYGQAVTGIDAALPPGATIAGTVTSHGKPLTGICVSPSGGGLQQGFAVTANGRYRVTNLQPGQYQVSFSPGCGTRAQNKAEQNLVGAFFGSQLNPPLVSAPAGITYGINAALVTGGSVGGERCTAGRARPCRSRASILTGLSGAAVAGSTESGVNDNGSYEVSQLLPGSYAVTFQPNCFSGNSYYENQWYKDKPSAAGASRVKVTGGAHDARHQRRTDPRWLHRRDHHQRREAGLGDLRHRPEHEPAAGLRHRRHEQGRPLPAPRPQLGPVRAGARALQPQQRQVRARRAQPHRPGHRAEANRERERHRAGGRHGGGAGTRRQPGHPAGRHLRRGVRRQR